MQPKTILRHLREGKTVRYTIRRLRGYLHGELGLEFRPADARLGENNIRDYVRNFRLDNKPYDKPVWSVT